MLDEIYKIFKNCFPDTLITKEEFQKNIYLNGENIVKFFEANNKTLVGFSIVYENCVALLCVEPTYQNHGIGTSLLKQSEKMIKEKGYDEVFLGYKNDDKSYFKGVPILNNDNYWFFSKFDYDNDFTCYDVKVSLDKQQDLGLDGYTITNTKSFKDVKTLFLELISTKDKAFYNRYAENDSIDFIFCRKDGELKGGCAYRTYESGVMEIYDLISYPSYDLLTKKVILNELKKVEKDENISKVIVKGVSNPIIYEENYEGEVTQKYWRGSKQC